MAHMRNRNSPNDELCSGCKQKMYYDCYFDAFICENAYCVRNIDCEDSALRRNKNLLFDLPQPLQDKIMIMKKEIEVSEENEKFQKYIEGRQEHNKKMDEMNYKFRKVAFTFGKYKGYNVKSECCIVSRKSYRCW